MTMERPVSGVPPAPTALALGVPYDQSYTIDITGTDSTGATNILTANATHVASGMLCPPGQTTCGTATLLTLSFLNQVSYA